MAQAPQQQNQGLMSRIGEGIESFFRSDKDLTPLRGQQPSRQQELQQNQPQQQAAQPQGATSAGATNDPNTLQNPLDVYAGMFDNKPKVDKDGNPVQAPQAPVFKLDPKTVQDAASKIKFTDGLPPELATKIQSGEQLSNQEMMEVVQHVGQRAYATAMEHNSNLTDRFVGMRLNHEQQGLPSQVRRLLAQTQVMSDDVIQSNPALKEHFEVIADRLWSKYPDQSPEWIAKETKEYFTRMARALNPNLTDEPAPQHNPRNGETTGPNGKKFDWDAYLVSQKS